MDNKVKNQYEHKVNLIEKCQVGPLPSSISSPNVVPLSFFDLPWLCRPTISCKRIFYYDFPYPKTQFLEKVLPNLKQSLSLALKHFFPFSSNIIFPPKPQTPHILYSEGDTLPFIVAHSTTNLNTLVSHTPKNVKSLDDFVPILPSPHTLEDGTMLMSPMSIQVTILSNSGFTICCHYSHVVADGKSFHDFLKFWSSLCTLKEDMHMFSSHEGLLSFPSLSRDEIGDPNEFKSIFLEKLWNMPLNNRIDHMNMVIPNNMVRQTIVLRHDHVTNLKKLVSMKCQSLGLGTSLHLSSFVLTCSLIWVSNVKSKLTQVGVEDDEELYFLILANCMYLSELKIPLTYFGNCLAAALVTIKRSKLEGKNGIFEAAIAIGSKVKELKSEPYKGVETLISITSSNDTTELSERVLTITGSPKFGSYEIDFGWGKPKLNELLHVNYPGIFSLSPCKDIEGGVEVGIALETSQMDKFNIIMNELLTNLGDHQD
ncbi:hypothetical protein PIB30_054938 [Stylosanthes scabra]|uniref:Uncharacterized protein n=1 Tax=Stylosanthes scabra TaxID=79078 RepID=A0ABU6YH65_9FABA|nr:hypothetical protein [Stylosanthes scabra]